MTRDTKDNKPKSSVAEDDPLLSQPPRGGGGGCIPYEIFDPVKVPQEWVDEFDRFETPGDIVFQSRNKIDVGIRGQNLDFKNLLATPSRSEKGDMVGHINGLRMTGHIPTGTNGWRLESANTNAEPQRDPETGNIILRASGCEGGPSLVCNKTLFRHSYILATPCATIGPVRWAGGSYGCGVFKHARCNNIIPRNPTHIQLIASREWIGTNGTHWGQVVYGCCGLNCRYNIRLALVFFLEDENRAVDRAIYGPVNFSQVLNSDHCLGNWASIFRWGPYPPIGDHRQLDVPVDLREFGNQSLDRFKRRDPTQAEIDQYGEGNIEQVIYIKNGNGTWYNLYWPDEIGSMLDPDFGCGPIPREMRRVMLLNHVDPTTHVCGSFISQEGIAPGIYYQCYHFYLYNESLSPFEVSFCDDRTGIPGSHAPVLQYCDLSAGFPGPGEGCPDDDLPGIDTCPPDMDIPPPPDDGGVGGLNGPGSSPQVRPLFPDIGSYLIAKFGPTATDDTAGQRLNICNACSASKTKRGKDYCDACNCPAWRDSELKRKVRMQNATCPLKLWAT